MEDEINFSIDSIIEEKIDDSNMRNLIRTLIALYQEEEWDTEKLSSKLIFVLDNLFMTVPNNSIEGDNE